MTINLFFLLTVSLVYKKSFINSTKSRHNKLVKMNKLFSKKKSYAGITEYQLYIPSLWNLYLLNCGIASPIVIKLYSKNLYFNLFLPKYFYLAYSNLWSSTLNVSCVGAPVGYSLWLKNSLAILDFMNSYYFNKIKFRGKGYYIYKGARSTITPQFGYAHRIYVYSFFNKVRFLGKTKVLIFGFLKSDVLSTLLDIKQKRPINIFTGRGVRFAKEIIYKKTGKVSSYR